jgi:hypothetical protein
LALGFGQGGGFGRRIAARDLSTGDRHAVANGFLNAKGHASTDAVGDTASYCDSYCDAGAG